MDQHLSFSVKSMSSPSKTSKVTPSRGKGSERKAHFGDLEEAHAASPVKKSKKKGKKAVDHADVPIMYSAPENSDVIIRQDKVSARRRRLLRQKNCRNWCCFLWIAFISLILIVTCLRYYTEESNADLLTRIKLLEARITVEENLQSDNFELIDARESSNTNRHDNDVAQLIDQLNTQTVRVDELKDAEADTTARLIAAENTLVETQDRATDLETITSAHNSRLQNLEADSGATIERTQALESFANQTLGRTQRLEILMADTINRVADLEDISEVTVERVGALEILTNSTENRTTILEGKTENQEGRLLVLETASTDTGDRLLVLETAKDDAATRIATLEATSALTVISLDQTRVAHIPSRVLAQMKVHTLTINSLIAIQPNGWVASASDDATVRLWNVYTGELLGTLSAGPPSESHTSFVQSLVLLKDGKHMCSAGADQQIIRWDISSLPPTKDHAWNAHSQHINAMALLPISGQIVSASNDRLLKVWDSTPPSSGTTTALRTLGRLSNTDPDFGHTNAVSSVIVIDSGHIVSGGGDGRVVVWDLTLDVPLRYMSEDLTDGVFALAALSPDLRTGERRVAASYRKETIRLWNPDTGDLITSYTPVPGVGGAVPIHSLAVLPDQTLVSGDANGKIRLWDSRDGEQWTDLNFEEGRLDEDPASSRTITALVVLHDGTLVSADDENVITSWRNGYVQPSLFA